MLGKIIGNYQITSELAQGGMGAVYRGRHQSLPREVVVKSILLSSFPPHLQDQLKARFVREAYIQSQLDHPNIVRVYEFFTTAENYYLVMEYVDGMSLRDLIKRQGAMSPAHAVPLFKQAISALDYSHKFNYVDESGNRNAGIIHRDIKPANLLLDGMARLKITDFGIVKLAGERGMTRTGFNPGTVEYMSPEQIRGLEVDARSDLYSLGVTFYEALTGRLPFPHSDTGSEYEVLRGHIELTPPPIMTLKPDTPPALAAAIMRSLEKDPNARYQSGAEFLEAIIDYEQGAGANGTARQATQNTPARAPQATHSMTEVISYDTRPAPITSTVTPPQRVQPSLETKVIEPAPQNHRAAPTAAAPQNHRAAPAAAEPPRRYGLLIVGALVVLIAAGAGAFLLLKPGGGLSSAAANVSSGDPIGAASPAATTQPTAPPPALQENPLLKNGQEAEAQERYADAIKHFGEYLRQNADAADAASWKTRVAELTKIQGSLSMADLEMDKRDYASAKDDYAQALKLRPDSKRAQSGLAAAEAQLAKKF